jgi:hypothetical protein
MSRKATPRAKLPEMAVSDRQRQFQKGSFAKLPDHQILVFLVNPPQSGSKGSFKREEER